MRGESIAVIFCLYGSIVYSQIFEITKNEGHA